MEVLSHPVTIIFLSLLFAAMGWILKAILDITKVQAVTTEILNHLVKSSEANSANITSLKSDFDRLAGQHEIIHGGMIGEIQQKKT